MFGFAAPVVLEAIPPGRAVEAVVREGVAASLRVSAHEGGNYRALPSGEREMVIPDTLGRWYGVYSRAVLENRWEPMDQPDGAAYLPLRYADVDRHPITPQFELLVQRHATRAPIRRSLTRSRGTCTLVSDPAALRDACTQVLTSFDLQRDEIEACLRLLTAV